MTKSRVHILVEGIVQGVGFRPFVYNLARKHGLSGWVLNDEKGVQIEVEGEKDIIQGFLSSLKASPPQARIENILTHDLPPVGDKSFEIRESERGGERSALVPPDIAICGDCLREFSDQKDRRVHYPFINCTNCGPRFTIIRDVPYDREKTTMAIFKMCSACEKEYRDPGNRRFHAEPNACPDCGPGLRLLDPAGREIAGPDPAGETRKLLKNGVVVAVKGMGGFHLAVSARNEEAVSRLRSRKYREDKPFALMARDLGVIRELCEADGEAEKLLESREAPIVVLPMKTGARVASSVAPFQNTLGMMLPYTPLHRLLFDGELDCLVMTSGNMSDEPIAYRDEEARKRLAEIADYFLFHNREIHTRCDDSVIKPFRGGTVFLRRARGYVPAPIPLARGGKSVLALGAELKNTFCLTKGSSAFVSHHIGDLENFETLKSFQEGIAHFRRFFEIEPGLVAYDLHPDYLSTRHAREIPLPRVGVQHHYAHALSVMAEHGLAGPALAVTMDGTGYGDDGTIWGGEFLEVSLQGYRRLAHIRYIPLPGGEQGIREPWRMAAVYLDRIAGEKLAGLDIPFVRELDLEKWSVLKAAVRRGINSPPCSSAGRLFDAVSALLGVRGAARYEGQAAIELEQAARRGEPGEYLFGLDEIKGILNIDPDPVIQAVVEEIRKGTDKSVISARFHNSVARVIARVAGWMRDRTGHSSLILSGGVFQNHFLLGRVFELLEGSGFSIYINRLVPANDGGISLGQAYYAMHQ
ncbi:MAG: carbamoyltransferase HypF [bacterium]|nr:carbamoyltransferase HypF [bacterium]